MNTLRTEDDYKRAIKDLVGQAEPVWRPIWRRDGESHETAMTDAQMALYMQGLDLAITEEATIALRAEFLRYSSVFDTSRSRDTIGGPWRRSQSPLIEEWINRYMADIAREVITEAIGKISHVRPTGAMRRPK